MNARRTRNRAAYLIRHVVRPVVYRMIRMNNYRFVRDANTPATLTSDGVDKCSRPGRRQ
jgi:hypothetical protein